MELAFIISAIRRYFWVVIVLAIVGVIPGLIRGGGDPTYESRGVLLVVPSADVAVAYSGDPDRYVVGQLSVLRSTAMADTVAESLGDGLTAEVVRTLVAFEHEQKTDIVEVVAQTPDVAFSQRIVNGYLDAYVGLIRGQAASAQVPLDEQITGTRGQLEDVNERIGEAMAPYLVAQPNAPGDAFPPIPGIDQVAPSLASQQSLLVSTLVGLQQERARIGTNSRSSLSGTVVQEATTPQAPVAEPGGLLIVVGLLAGTFVGVLSAVVIARLSPRVLDDLHAEETLGAPPIGVFPYARVLAADRRAAVENPPANVLPFVDALCVRTDASSQSGATLTVVVVGTHRAAGATTLASVVANRFANNGTSVLLIDADQQHPMLTSLFASRSSAARKAGNKNNADSSRRPPAKPQSGLLTSMSATAVRNLRVATFGSGLLSPTVRRRHVGEVLEEARAQADVVVFDGGSLMASSSTLELTRICDAVILVMPRDQKVRSLAVVAKELKGRSILAVWSRAHRSGRRPLWYRARGVRAVRDERDRGAGKNAPESFPAPVAREISMEEQLEALEAERPLRDPIAPGRPST